MNYWLDLFTGTVVAEKDVSVGMSLVSNAALGFEEITGVMRVLMTLKSAEMNSKISNKSIYDDGLNGYLV